MWRDAEVEEGVGEDRLRLGWQTRLCAVRKTGAFGRGAVCILENSAYDATEALICGALKPKGKSILSAIPPRPAHWVAPEVAVEAGDTMKLFAIVLALVSFTGMIFGWWGLETVAGRRHFDEMAGMIPLFAGIASIILLLVAAILYYLAGR